MLIRRLVLNVDSNNAVLAVSLLLGYIVVIAAVLVLALAINDFTRGIYKDVLFLVALRISLSLVSDGVSLRQILSLLGIAVSDIYSVITILAV